MKKGSELKKAVEFHGHLGPYLVLGLVAGRLALERLGCRKHFGLEVKVRGADKKPKSCFIDGLQLSTGATYGKGNIRKLPGKQLIFLCQECGGQAIEIRLKKDLIRKLGSLKTHAESERCAKKLLGMDEDKLFRLSLKLPRRRK